MKKLLVVILAALCLFAGCGKAAVSTPTSLSATEKILDCYNTLSKTTDSSVLRNVIAELEKLTTDETLSEEELMFAKYSYNVAYGVVKLTLSGKAISVFDFPEIEMYGITIGLIANGDMVADENTVADSEDFLKKVEEFLK